METAPLPIQAEEGSDDDLPTTPTKIRRTNADTDGLLTPRASRSDPAATPRGPRFTSQPHADTQHNANMGGDTIYGFTLSYLRRVPELASLARRIVHAERRRRDRKERQAAALKEVLYSGNISSRTFDSTVSHSSTKSGKGARTTKGEARELVGPKMKRLFTLTIRKLFNEGAIVLWDGPRRQLSSLTNPDMSTYSTRQSNLSTFSLTSYSSSLSSIGEHIWSLGSSRASQSQISSSMLSSASHALSMSQEDEDEGAMSDPPLVEDAYIPLTPALLVPHVERAVEEIIARERRRARIMNPATRAGSGSGSGGGRKHDGTTKEDIAAFLKKSEDRWRRVGEWIVGDALVLLEEEGKVWEVGVGRWELCV
jgi:hypothetical protein